MKPIIYILTAGLLFVASQVFGQAVTTTLTPATVTAPIGNKVELQLKVTNFSNINSIQFPITYNATVLKFDTIFNSALPGWVAGNYNATSGKITISWFADPGGYPSGFSIADNSSIFTLRFTVLTNGSSPVNIANQPPGIEIIKNNAPVTLNYQSGGAQVTGGSGGGGGGIQGFAIIANTIYIPQGSIGCMPVTVNDFNNILSMQYAMHWDPAILEYQNTQAYNLPGLAGNSFGGTPASGLQLVGWDDPNAAGVTRANGTKIYDVCFKAVGAPGTSSLIVIDSIGFPPGNGSAEAFNAASQNVWTSNSGVKDTIFVVTGAPPANALTFTASYDTVGTGETACIEVRVKNFNSIISMQYGMSYDATKLTNVTITPGPSVPGLNAANFNTVPAGQIKLSWVDPDVAGKTLPDNTLLFTVCFTVAAPTGSLVPVNFGSLPGLPVEVVKEPDGPVNPFFVNGHVYVATVAGPQATMNVKNACGGNNGSATAGGIGGTPTSYQWSVPGSGNVQTINNLAPGTYSVTVTFAGGATATATEIIESSPSITVNTSQQQNVKCHNETNGSIDLTVNGGTPNFSYSWTGPNNFTANTVDITGLAAGIYSFTATDSKGCTAAQNYTITNPPAVTVSLATSKNVACFGTASGQITINSGGGTPTLSHKWYDVSINPPLLVTQVKNPNDLTPGTYNVTVTDINGCTSTLPNPVTINGPTSALTFATPIQKTDVLCWGYNTGAINVSISGGWSGQYTVTWDPQPYTGANLTAIPAGTYNGTITDQGGCQVVLPPVAILSPPAITYGTPVVVNNICANDGDGSITIQVSGGNDGPFTVNWNGGLSGQSISNLDGGDYTPTITDGDGCTAVLSPITVNEPAPILASNEVVVDPAPGMNDGAIALDLTGGTPPLTITWTGPGGFTADTDDIFNLAAGSYTLTVKDANNCTYTKNYVVGGALVGGVVVASASCGNDGCVDVQIAAGSPPFIISWTGAASGSFITSDLNASICTFIPGTFNFTIADNASNTLSIPGVFIDQKEPALASVQKNNPVEDLGNGSITLTPIVPPGSTPNFSYEWSGPNGPISGNQAFQNGLDSGLYIVTVTNENSDCESIYEITLVQEWPAIQFASPTVNTPNCLNTTDGSISANVSGGNPPYIYAWTGPNGFTANTQNISGLAPGTYNLTVTDENGTTSTTTATLVAESQLAITNVNETSSYGNPPYQVSGVNECDGVASVVFSGGVGTTSILWSNNVTGAQNTTLCAGQYSVSVTDGLGCVSVWSDSLTFPPGVGTTLSMISEISCHGECDGVARVFVNGGVAPYTVKWSTGQTDQVTASGGFSQAVNLCGGAYKVSVTDQLGADYTFDISIPEPAEIEIAFASVPSTTFNSCDAEFIAEVTGGANEPFTYVWSGSYGHSGTGQRAEGLCAGEIVEFIVTDANGCRGIGRDTVAYPEDGCYQVRPVITPGDQDGNNDFVIITCIEAVPNSIEIYNRWGQLVFEATGYDNAGTVWKGLTKNGQPLAEGVYFYILNYTDPVRGPEQKKGHINLLR